MRSKKVNVYSISGDVLEEVYINEDFNISEFLEQNPRIYPNELNIRRLLRDVNAVLGTDLRTIMFIDDQKDVVEVMKAQAEIDGHYAEGYTDADFAYERYFEIPNLFEIVVVDFDMPGIDGGRFAEIIKSKEEAATVILLTGLMTLNVKDIHNLPILYKPVTVQQIINAARVYEYQNAFKRVEIA